jgi:WD40 repeat protein
MRDLTTHNGIAAHSAGDLYLQQRLSRRCFLVIAGTALLTGCQPQQQSATRPAPTAQSALQSITAQNAQHLVQVAELDAGGVAVRSAAWSPDRKQVAAGYADGMVIRWNVKTGQRLLLENEISSDPRPFAVFGIAWSPDGERIASNRYDSHIYLWDASTGKKLATLTTYDKPNGIAWSPDGRLLAVTDDSGAVEIWGGKTLKDQVNMLAHPEAGWCYGVSWSPDGRMVAGARQDGLVQVWEAATQKELAALTGHTRAAWTLSWSLDNLHIASGSDDTTVRLWGVQ